MITIKRLLETTRTLLTNPRALAVFAVLYALLLATLYAFISIREATVWQVAVTMFFLVLIPAEFFVLQAAILQHSRAEKFHWGQIIRDAIKFAVVTIPIILLGYALVYLLNKWKGHFPAPTSTGLPVTPGPAKPSPLHLPTMLFATLRFLLLGLVLPLATIHLWIEVAAHDVRTSLGGGAKSVLKRIGNAFARALAFDSVLIYALGLIIFVLIPYAILFVPISKVMGTKTDFTVFIARLVLVYLFTLVGWIVTLSALARTTGEIPVSAPAAPAGTVPDKPAEAPA
jgi:hypothetical protein